MKSLGPSIPLLLLFFGLVCGACGSEDHDLSTPPAQPSRVEAATKNIEVSPQTAARMEKMQQVSDLMRAQEYGEAETLVDEELGNPSFGTYMAECKAELLAKRDEDSEALDLYLAVFSGQHGRYSPYFPTLAEAFQLAEGLERWSDADTIAVLLLANQIGSVGSYAPLRTPTSADTPTERRAYSYLALAHYYSMGHSASVEEGNEKQVELCLQAKDLLPDSPIVLLHLATAYSDRDGYEAVDVFRPLLEQAYDEASGNPSTQAEIAKWAKVLGAVPFP